MQLKSEKNDLRITMNGNEYYLKRIHGRPIAINVHDDKDIWHASSSSNTFEDILSNNTEYTAPFTISLAVAAGNIYHLMLGDPQPIMAMGVDNKGNYWRLSKQVDQYKNWSDCVSDDGAHLLIFKRPLISGTNLVGDQNSTMSIVKLTEIIIAGLFLNDLDFNPGNFGLTPRNNELVAVKIDPEYSFVGFINKKVSVSSIKELLTDYLLIDPIDVWSSLSDYADTDNSKKDLLYILHSEFAHKEKMAFLSKFVSMDISQLTSILKEQVVAKTTDLKILKSALIDKITQRFANFKTAFEDIKDTPFKSIISLDEEGGLCEDDFEPEIDPDSSEETNLSDSYHTSDYFDSSEDTDAEDAYSPNQNNPLNKRKLSDSNSPNPTPLKKSMLDSNHCFFYKQWEGSSITNNWIENPQTIEVKPSKPKSPNSHHVDQNINMDVEDTDFTSAYNNRVL